MRTLKGYILLTRPLNLLIAFLSIFVGGFVTGTIQPLGKLLSACCSGALVMAGANCVNDYFDLAIDRINKPGRPLPSGMVSPERAFVFSIFLFAMGVVVGCSIHRLAFLIALGSSILLYLYSYRLKRTAVWGNLTVAFVTGLAFVYGGLAVGRVGSALVVGVFAFFYHWGREIIKDVEDVEGDRALGARTLPVACGRKVAFAWATGVLVVLMGLTLVPYFLDLFSFRYLIVVVLGVDVFLGYVLFSMWRKPEPANLHRLAFLMKVDMFVGLVAVYVGG